MGYMNMNATATFVGLERRNLFLKIFTASLIIQYFLDIPILQNNDWFLIIFVLLNMNMKSVSFKDKQKSTYERLKI